MHYSLNSNKEDVAAIFDYNNFNIASFNTGEEWFGEENGWSMNRNKNIIKLKL